MYYTYMLRCEDNSIYTGITTDLERRMNEHISQNEKSAKYTKRHKAEKLERAWRSENKSQASKLEYRIKQLPKTKKEELISNPKIFGQIFENILEIQEYKLYI